MKAELRDLADPSKFNGPIDLGDTTVEEGLRFLSSMLLIRKAEEKIGENVANGTIRCPCHLAIGQEAVAVGVAAELRKTDRGFGTHRSHSHYLSVGGDVFELFAEVLGKASGCSGGMGGSMHLWAQPQGFVGSVPIVAGTVSLAVGAGLAAEMDTRRRIFGDGYVLAAGQEAFGGSLSRRQHLSDVGIAYFGDGAAEEGSVHESMNLASQMRAPVLFVCENNLFSSHLHIKLRQPSDRVSRYAEAHQLQFELVDGNDVVGVRRAARRLLERARRGDGPGFLEAITYRWRGHVGPSEDNDVGLQRKDDLKAWKGRDPVRRLRESLLLAGGVSDRELERLEMGIQDQVERAWQSAVAAPYPEPQALLDLVFAPSAAPERGLS